jgi:opacity protein-like surface antigen
VNHAEDATLNGVILDDASPLYNNYSYNYKVNHTSVDLKAKLLVTNSTSFTPWISAKLGVGFNYAHAFQNYPTIFEALPIANFASHSTTSFTYGLGVGVQKAIDQSWQIGLGYEFSDWGKSQLGRAPGQNVNSGLTLNHMYTNSLLINVAYIK